jgi:hypothetical protein
MLDYTIVVPSRKRAHNMLALRQLLPTALICVDERERADYESAVPAERLLWHPPMDGQPFVINWMQEAVKSPIWITIDDDFCGVQVTTGSRRWVTDSEEILAIIENAAQACLDLGLTAFCWSRTANTTVIRPDERPIVPVQAVCNAFGIMGAARHRKYDTTLPGRAAVDWTLRTLLEDRLVYADVRFYFDCGPVFTGRGGNVGLVLPEQFTETTRRMLRRWGASLSFNPPGYVKKREVAAMSIRVTRSHKTAQR